MPRRPSLAALPTDCTPACPVQRAARVIDGKWTTLIVRDLLGGQRGFSELQRSLHPVSPRLLTARLRLLEEEGVLTRTVHATVPPTTEYALTEHGRLLLPVIEAMAAFGVASQRRDGEKPATPASRNLPGRRVHRLR